MVTKHTLFGSSKSETKAKTTTSVAKTLIDKETAARDAKTKRLREARLEREATEAKVEPPAKKAKTSTRKPKT